jgi:hypothetical protein
MTAVEEDILLYFTIQNLSMSRAMGNSSPADSVSAAHDAPDIITQDSTAYQTDSSRRDSTEIEETATNVESTTVEGQHKNRANPESVSLDQPEATSTKSHTPDWVPRCPYCETANEYGHVMCDAVLPGICQNGDDGGRGDEESRERDVALYGVLSTFA